MSLLDRFLKKTNWDKLPESHQLAALWYRFIEWENDNGSGTLIDEYFDFMNWLPNELEWYEIDFNNIPKITNKKYIKIWFKIDKMLDLDSLKSIPSHPKFIRGNKWRLIDRPPESC